MGQSERGLVGGSRASFLFNHESQLSHICFRGAVGFSVDPGRPRSSEPRSTSQQNQPDQREAGNSAKLSNIIYTRRCTPRMVVKV